MYMPNYSIILLLHLHFIININLNKIMKSGINNTPSEVPNSQILYAGFNILKTSNEMKLIESYSYNNMIIFILKGSLKICFTHTDTKFISDRYMIFIKMCGRCTYEITPYSEILLFTFDHPVIDELLCFQSQYGLLPKSAFEWIELEINEPLYNFLMLLVQYQENNYLDYTLYSFKRDELFYLLKAIYPKEKLGNFFYLLNSQPSEFEKLVAANYTKAKNVKELASLMGYGINSFRVKFKETFGIPPYQWLLNEKAKLILRNLIKNGDDFKKIIDDFGFTSHSHLYKFCKMQYGLTPEELKKKIIR